MKEEPITVSLVLSQNDRDIIQEFAAQNGLNFSSAARWIVREWARHCRPTTFTARPDSHLEAAYEDRVSGGQE